MPKILSNYFVIKIVGGEISNTTAGFSAEQKDGIGLSQKGRLCNFMSGKSMEFLTHKDASEFIENWKHREKYICEILETGRWIET